ncbi:MAG: thioredoxin [Clostridia bacterium]|nr:thioredoxin [Clostridia bacterium]
MIKYIDETNFKTEVLESKNAVLVDFFATWCGPCSMLSPVLEKISNTRADFNIVKVDIDKLRDLAIDYDIEVVPTLLIFKNGNIVHRIEGFVSEEEIISTMLEYK